MTNRKNKEKKEKKAVAIYYLQEHRRDDMAAATQFWQCKMQLFAFPPKTVIHP